MDKIQVNLKAVNNNGILSIQGIDLFHIIDVDWNWNNISLIQDSCLKTFFIHAKKLLDIDFAEELENDFNISNDEYKYSEEINSYYEELFYNFDFQRAWLSLEMEDNDPSDEIEINYDTDDLDRTEINLLIPYYRFIWDESLYRYIYDNLNLWALNIEDEIKVYNELCSVIDKIPAIISAIRIEKSPSKAIRKVMQIFNISKQTAKTIGSMKLYRLLTLTVSDCKKILQHKKKVRSTITKLIILKKKITDKIIVNGSI